MARRRSKSVFTASQAVCCSCGFRVARGINSVALCDWTCCRRFSQSGNAFFSPKVKTPGIYSSLTICSNSDVGTAGGDWAGGTPSVRCDKTVSDGMTVPRAATDKSCTLFPTFTASKVLFSILPCGKSSDRSP